jgi:hypothetical protein
MGRTFTATQGGLTPMWRRDDAGNLEQVEPEPNEYENPARGTRGRIRLNGISDEFEMPNKFSEEPGAMVKKVRVEFEVIKASGKNASATGMRFTDLYTMSIHPKSNLGKLLGTLRGRDIVPGETVDIDSFIGTNFVAMTRLSDDGLYAGVSPEAIEPDSITLFSANGTAPAGPAFEPDDDDTL